MGGLRKEYEPKLKGARDKMESILTDDQKRARAEAFNAAQAAGKGWADAGSAGQAAMKLTDEQKAKMSDAQKEMRALYKEFDGKFRAS